MTDDQFEESLDLLRKSNATQVKIWSELDLLNFEVAEGLKQIRANQKEQIESSGKSGGVGTGSGSGAKPKKRTKSLFGQAKDAVRGGRLGRAYSRVKAVAGRALGGKGSSGMKGLGKGGKGFAKGAGAAGVAVAAVVAVGVALNEFRKAVVKATDEQLANARKLAEISPQMAVLFAQTDVQELQRNMRKGREQAGSTRQLAQADQRRKNAMEPLENAVAEIKNQTLAALNDSIIPAIKVCADIAQWMKRNWPWGRFDGLAADAAARAVGGVPIGLAGDIARPGGFVEEADAIDRGLRDARRAARGGDF